MQRCEFLSDAFVSICFLYDLCVRNTLMNPRVLGEGYCAAGRSQSMVEVFGIDPREFGAEEKNLC